MIGLLLALSSLVSAGTSTEAVQPLVDRARSFLLQTPSGTLARGELALVTLALVKSSQDGNHQAYQTWIDTLARAAAESPYKPQGGVIPDVYESAVMLMTLSAVDSSRYRAQIQNLARFLESRRTPGAAWDYPGRSTGDTSQTQYGALALWEASLAGVSISGEVWDDIAHWLIRHQDVEGGFTYHPVTASGNERLKQPSVSHSMTVAGIGTLYICRDRLASSRGFASGAKSEEKREAGEFPLLTRVEGASEADPSTPKRGAPVSRKTSRSAIDGAIEDAKRWLSSNFTIEKPNGPQLYYLYGVERYGNLAKTESIGSHDWYAEGCDYLQKTQRENGQFTSTTLSYAPWIDTSFGVLFLVQSTKKSALRIQITRLDGGDLVGGRGAPKFDGVAPELRARQSTRYRGALRTPVEDILGELSTMDEPIVDENAAAALETATPDEIVRSVKGDWLKLARLTRHADPIVRAAGTTALARTGELRAGSFLLERLEDENSDVYRAALSGLRFLSRDMEGKGLGPTPPESKEERAAGIKRWREWFDSLHLDLDPRQKFEG